jgi:hypothetical protein
MALLNVTNRYIKLTKDGYYEIYPSAEARLSAKESTHSDIILRKYQELLAELDQQDEFRYYDPDGFDAVYMPLLAEYRRYHYNLINHIVGQEYPIMAEFYTDVNKSIPEIISTGYTYLPSTAAIEDTATAYLIAKKVKRFGETTDA